MFGDLFCSSVPPKNIRKVSSNLRNKTKEKDEIRIIAGKDDSELGLKKITINVGPEEPI